MITTDEIRNTKLEDLFSATIKKELTWEEAEKYPFKIDGFPECSTADDVLKMAVDLTLEEIGEMSELAVRQIEEEVKKEILSDLTEEQDTILLKKDGNYYDLAEMKMLDSSYKIIKMNPLSKCLNEK